MSRLPQRGLTTNRVTDRERSLGSKEEFKLGEDNSDLIKIHPALNCAFFTVIVFACSRPKLLENILQMRLIDYLLYL